MHKMWFMLPALTLLAGAGAGGGLGTAADAAAQTLGTATVGAATERRTGPSVDQLMNRGVVGADGKRIGTVTDVILDEKGQAQYIVIHSGGLFGFGGKDIAADLKLADIRPGGDSITLREVTAASVREMPEFRYDDSITSLTRSPETRSPEPQR
ncbi:PRC-barrel domain-containing protein [Azospirillum picis]|uniref:Sporulation protein YlmC with PRC-barrel domain n=1 Tax=Azospirillum picis TaxID=488438 RepID=A0ABU0MPN5_9PROT|nr:PRC-barrel domain-containing protein [Azospirillum picis]MBP2301742.1 sporulation protein YlmC with PRC-barrel domain [Azospirillum picis]MDQ0535434.1 sporulation protein YlmC with PRC-barrel domain [Azospirillum picis]